ncbi:YcjF family protein [Teichococcus wenyumeiae]|nr:DUF697 domain-containing protein [Pseudoroseomonas wenyumeiae]
MSTTTQHADNAMPAVLSQGDRLAAASQIISNSCGWSAACGIIPLPVVDLVALGAVQATMINRIAKLYGESISSESARSLISVLLGTLAPGMATGVAGAVVGSGIKAVPGVGLLLGGAALAGFSAAATYAIGKIFVRHFEGGGTFGTFSADAVQADLQREFTSAKTRNKAG